jgi:hypothetical protein
VEAVGLQQQERGLGEGGEHHGQARRRRCVCGAGRRGAEGGRVCGWCVRGVGVSAVRVWMCPVGRVCAYICLARVPFRTACPTAPLRKACGARSPCAHRHTHLPPSFPLMPPPAPQLRSPKRDVNRPATPACPSPPPTHYPTSPSPTHLFPAYPSNPPTPLRLPPSPPCLFTRLPSPHAPAFPCTCHPPSRLCPRAHPHLNLTPPPHHHTSHSRPSRFPPLHLRHSRAFPPHTGTHPPIPPPATAAAPAHKHPRTNPKNSHGYTHSANHLFTSCLIPLAASLSRT